MAAESTQHASRESPLLADLRGPRFSVAVHHGMRIAERTDGAPPADGFVVDVSAIPRRLIAGSGAAQWLEAHGLPCPGDVQGWCALGAGGLVAQIHYGQYLVIDQPDGGAAPALFADSPDRGADVLILDHDQADIAVSGSARDAVLAELCAVEMDYTADDWRSVRLAHCDVGLWQLSAPVPHTRVLCTPADARFLFGVLRECVTAAAGEVVGFTDYLALTAARTVC
ncbi:MAG: hypothetical protein WD928_15765 [Gammaproteobacteria bacterium]